MDVDGNRVSTRTYTPAWLKAREERTARRAADPVIQKRARDRHRRTELEVQAKLRADRVLEKDIKKATKAARAAAPKKSTRKKVDA